MKLPMTFEEKLEQSGKVLDEITGFIMKLDYPDQVVAVLMTLFDTFVEAHPDEEERALDMLQFAIDCRDSVIAMSGTILKNAEGVN